MPIEPSVFQPIRPNDYQERPFYAYKRYFVNHVGFTTESGYVRHDAIYLGFPEPVGVDNQGSLSFAGTNVEDNTQKTVVWSVMDHKYYRHPYDPAKTFEHSNRDATEKFLWYSASILTFPYFQSGEKVKPGSVTGSFIVGDTSFKLIDDGLGNLRDPLVITSSFASQSKSILHLSFNNTFRQFKNVENLGLYNDGLEYRVGEAQRFATPSDVACRKDGVILDGTLFGSTAAFEKPSGLAAHFIDRSSYIRIAHSKEFDRFNKCDDWTICFWIKKQTTGSDTRHIITKGGVIEESFLDELTTFERKPPNPHIQIHGPGHAHHGKGRKSIVKPKVVLQRKTEKIIKRRDRNVPLPDILSSYRKFRTPFMIGVQTTADTDLTHYHFRSSDGETELHISASTNTTGVSSLSTTQAPASAWDHVLIRNQDQVCKFFINGIETGQSGSLPVEPTANKQDIMIGSPNTIKNFLPNVLKRATLGVDGEVSVYEVSGSLTTIGTVVIEPNVLLIVRGDMFINAPTVTVQSGGTLKVFGDIIENESGFLVVEEGGSVIVPGDVEDLNDYYLSEVRMFSYGVDQTGISSLANRNYLSGSLYQTNVAGNIFYKNLQMVVSSPMPKYSSGSGAFNEEFEVKYRGQHKIYENEVLVRVPRDIANVPMNPTANYRPATVGDICAPNHQNIPTGELRKPLFVSGTLKPYITTIGLYDENARMLAIGKLSTPVQKLDDVDMNFIVRWDY